MTGKAAAIVVCGMLGACTASPAVSGVDPAHGDCTVDLQLRIRGSALGAEVQVDLQEGAVGHVSASVGSTSLRDVTVLSGSVVTGTLPGGRLTAGGDYDVTVQTAAGASAVLEGAFHCDGEPPVDAGDEGDGELDDGADEGAEADAGGPVGPVLTLSEAGHGRYGSAPSVAWVADRWVAAWVDDDGADGLLRLAEILPGATEPAAVRVIEAAVAGRPVDPLVRAWAGMVWLGWHDRAPDPQQFRFRLFDDALGLRAVGGALGTAADDVFWRRDHDVAREPVGGQLLFVGPMLGGAAYALVRPDGTLAVPATGLPSGTDGVSDVRTVWTAGGFHVLWTENPTAATRVRGAVVRAAGTLASGPVDLPFAGETAAPVVWGDERTDPAHLFLCGVRLESSTARRVVHRLASFELEALTDEAALWGTGRAARCAVGGGLAAWSLQGPVSSFSLARIAADGSTTTVAAGLGRAVRAAPGVDVAAGPGGHAVVWLEDRAPGEPVAVRFAEVTAEP